MKMEGLTPDVISRNAVISASEKGGDWPRALALLHEIKSSQGMVGIETYTAVMMALAAAGQMEESFRLLHDFEATLRTGNDLPENVYNFYLVLLRASRAAKDSREAEVQSTIDRYRFQTEDPVATVQLQSGSVQVYENGYDEEALPGLSESTAEGVFEKMEEPDMLSESKRDIEVLSAPLTKTEEAVPSVPFNKSKRDLELLPASLTATSSLADMRIFVKKQGLRVSTAGAGRTKLAIFDDIVAAVGAG